MEITEVRIKLMDDSDDRLQGFCSITFDNAFVIRDLKIIEGSSGPFVAMPSRKLTGHCHQCGCKNHLKAGYCNHCGVRLREDRLARDVDGRTKLYADIAHPINSACREMIQNRVIAEYRAEQERAKMPGYVSRYDDDYEDDHLPHAPESRREARSASPPPAPAAPVSAPAASVSSATAPPATVPANIPLPPGSHVEPAETVIRAPHMLPHRNRPSTNVPATQTPATQSAPATVPVAERPAESRSTEFGTAAPAPTAPKTNSPEPTKPTRGPGEFGAGIF